MSEQASSSDNPPTTPIPGAPVPLMQPPQLALPNPPINYPNPALHTWPALPPATPTPTRPTYTAGTSAAAAAAAPQATTTLAGDMTPAQMRAAHRVERRRGKGRQLPVRNPREPRSPKK